MPQLIPIQILYNTSTQASLWLFFSYRCFFIYSNHLNTGQVSGIGMVQTWLVKWSGFQMVASKLDKKCQIYGQPRPNKCFWKVKCVDFRCLVFKWLLYLAFRIRPYTSGPLNFYFSFISERDVWNWDRRFPWHGDSLQSKISQNLCLK